MIHELAHAHREADGPSFTFELEDERVACMFRLPTHFPLDRVERPHGLARHGVGVREDRLPSVAVSSSPQATIGEGKVLHLYFLPFGFQQPFLSDIVTAKTRLEMQKKQIPIERWKLEKTQNACLEQCVQTR